MLSHSEARLMSLTASFRPGRLHEAPSLFLPPSPGNRRPDFGRRQALAVLADPKEEYGAYAFRRMAHTTFTPLPRASPRCLIGDAVGDLRGRQNGSRPVEGRGEPDGVLSISPKGSPFPRPQLGGSDTPHVGAAQSQWPG